MNNAELLKILKDGGAITVPYFNGATIPVAACDFVSAEDALPALKAFLTLSNGQRLSDGRHLVAYCHLMVDAVGDEEILGDMDGVVPTAEGVWEYAKATNLFFGKLNAGKYVSKPTVYLQIEGSVVWEPEHGLQMSWENGSKLVKAGPFDGHPTNDHASANPTKGAYVFACYLPSLCTLPDPD